jgi:E3 ubiquitin-protein ligase synoviolin
MRLLTLVSFLLVADVLILLRAATLVQRHGPSVQILFGYESVILASSALAMLAKYAVHLLDTLRGGAWDGKGAALFYLELVTDLFHLAIYLVFFVVIARAFRLPLHLLRDLYKTFRSFRARIGEFLRYRRAAARVFPDASAAELARNDPTCVICRDEMAAAKRLPCGHLFHAACLRAWMERQQACPTCRVSVFDAATAGAVAGAGAAADAAADAADAAADAGAGAGADADAGAGAGAAVANAAVPNAAPNRPNGPNAHAPSPAASNTAAGASSSAGAQVAASGSSSSESGPGVGTPTAVGSSASWVTSFSFDFDFDFFF